uniref:Uncharacterized protein n=1 Tax=Ascaris lumbricoides TaxID=6252 RepID=A0A9J2Q5G0_ASCLU
MPTSCSVCHISQRCDKVMLWTVIASRLTQLAIEVKRDLFRTFRFCDEFELGSEYNGESSMIHRLFQQAPNGRTAACIALVNEAYAFSGPYDVDRALPRNNYVVIDTAPNLFLLIRSLAPCAPAIENGHVLRALDFPVLDVPLLTLTTVRPDCRPMFRAEEERFSSKTLIVMRLHT